MALDGSDLLEHDLRSRLLGRFLRAALPDARLLPVDVGRAGEGAIVRRPVDVEHGVADRLATARERLLKLCLEVDVARERVLDPGREGIDDRLLDLPEAVLEEKGGERGLEQRGENVAVLHQPLQLLLRNQLLAASLQSGAEVELAGDDGTARPGDDV